MKSILTILAGIAFAAFHLSAQTTTDVGPAKAPIQYVCTHSGKTTTYTQSSSGYDYLLGKTNLLGYAKTLKVPGTWKVNLEDHFCLVYYPHEKAPSVYWSIEFADKSVRKVPRAEPYDVAILNDCCQGKREPFRGGVVRGRLQQLVGPNITKQFLARKTRTT